MSVKELMSFYGYVYSGNCNCSGAFTEKYRRKDFYQFKWRKHKYQFMIKHKNDVIVNWTPVKDAEQKLKELHVAVEA